MLIFFPIRIALNESDERRAKANEKSILIQIATEWGNIYKRSITNSHTSSQTKEGEKNHWIWFLPSLALICCRFISHSNGKKSVLNFFLFLYVLVIRQSFSPVFFSFFMLCRTKCRKNSRSTTISPLRVCKLLFQSFWLWVCESWLFPLSNPLFPCFLSNESLSVSYELNQDKKKIRTLPFHFLMWCDPTKKRRFAWHTKCLSLNGYLNRNEWAHCII